MVGSQIGQCAPACASVKAFRHHPNARISGLRARFCPPTKTRFHPHYSVSSPLHIDCSILKKSCSSSGSLSSSVSNLPWSRTLCSIKSGSRVPASQDEVPATALDRLHLSIPPQGSNNLYIPPSLNTALIESSIFAYRAPLTVKATPLRSPHDSLEIPQWPLHHLPTCRWASAWQLLRKPCSLLGLQVTSRSCSLPCGTA
jgi:hypothetical protein